MRVYLKFQTTMSEYILQFTTEPSSGLTAASEDTVKEVGCEIVEVKALPSSLNKTVGKRF